MDPANTSLGRLLLKEITPVVMVLSTPLAEEACQKNGLSFVQMLAPFCLFNKIDVPVRTASDQPYRLQMFKLRMVYASDIHQTNYEAAEDHLKRVVSDASENALSDLQSDPPQLLALSSMERESYLSWFFTFNEELIKTLSFSEHEAFDHPVACLLVVSSRDEEPTNRFVDLFNTGQLPSPLNEGAMDPKILKHYLLLHDKQEDTTEKAINILAEMRNTFGLNDCRLLCINSGQEGVVECKENLWVHYKNDASISQGVSCLLSIDDINEIRDNMLDFSSKHIIPHMEQKVRILNQQVSATRKGFRNQIKNLWWRKGKEDAPDAPNAPSYTFSSIESQIRVLGDYAFMLRDYELALSNYRLLSTDYKLDKAWKRYAGVQEMVGLSLFLLDQSRKDAEYCMENAFNTYLRVGASGQRNATRCGIWWAEMLKARGQLKEAAGVYFRISNEEPSLHAAVMLEKASYCFLCSNPPMLRKYGFHLVMAGNRYYVSDQRKYAIRAYRNALPVYEGNAWNYINDHVHFNIGRWYASLGMFDKAIKHMLEVLACTHQSLVTQDLFLSDFLRIVQDVGKKYEVLELQLPIINMSSLRIMFEDHRTYASSSAVHVRESLWHSLEEDMVPSVATAKFNWLESQSKLSSLKKHNDTNICVVGEAIKLFLEFKNPLQISISISGVSLLCELSTGSAATVVDESKSATDTLHSGVLCGNRGLDSDNSSFVTSELNFVLGGDETRGVQLDVTPKMEGYLKVLGVKWTLSDSVSGYHYFDFNLSKKKHRKGRGVGHSSIHNLTFTVVKSLPKLEGYIHHMPRKTYTGDLQLLMLELKNQSEHTVKNVKMKISHPRFLIPGSLEDMNSEFPGCLKKQISFEHKDMHETFMEKSKGLPYSFPNDAAIQGGAIFLWPLWLHAGASGNVSLYISIYYEVDNFYSDIKYRTLRMHYELEVLPSLELSILITPGPSSLREFLVHMDIVNRTSSKSFWLHQLSSVGCQWDISSLQAYVSFCPSPLLLAGQALSCFFKLKDCGESSLNENKFTIHGSDARIGSQDDNEALFDVTRSPLANFHFHERSLQRKPLKGCPSQVDFILISKLVGDDANLEQGEPPRLFSHHACHCSVTKNSPIWWLMDGPRSIDHDFSVSFCEARFHMTIRNCSAAIASVKITTFDAMPNSEQPSDVSPVSDSSENQVVGWHDVSLVNDMAVVISDVRGTQFKKPSPPRSIISPFVWCSSSSTQVKLEPLSSAEIPLRICAFSPGTYDLSNYEVHWSLQLFDDAKGFTKDDVTRQSSGTIGGHPFYITILQSQP